MREAADRREREKTWHRERSTTWPATEGVGEDSVSASSKQLLRNRVNFNTANVVYLITDCMN